MRFFPVAMEPHPFNIARLATSAYAKAHVSGGHESYQFHARSASNRYEHPGAGGEADNGIEIASGLDKFLIGHEAGHAFMHRRTAVNQTLLWDYSLIGETCTVLNNHDIDTKEYSGSNFNEAFASYFAAVAFNNTSQTDCSFYHPSFGGVDCESGELALPVQFMETNCAPVAAGRGVEVDMLRALWDVHTNSGGVSMQDVVDWLSVPAAWPPFCTYGCWRKDNAYSRLDAAANTVGGLLNTNWDAAKTANGVDH